MGHTNSTPNYALPQFVTTDKPAWLTDINSAFGVIDTAIDAAKDAADNAQGDATQALTDASTASTAAATADAKGAGAVASIADAFDATAIYAVGDVITYNNLLYICIADVVTPGPWTGSTNWARTTVEDLIPTQAEMDAKADKSDFYPTGALNVTQDVTPFRSDNFQYIKSGNVVELIINNVGYATNYTSDTKIGHINVNPISPYNRGYIRNGDGNPVNILVNNAGEILIANNGAGKLLYGSFTFLAW